MTVHTSNEQNPTHTLQTSGRYSVSLTVDDGTNNSITVKNNLIWATAVQDTLWEEGFESNPYGRIGLHGKRCAWIFLIKIMMLNHLVGGIILLVMVLQMVVTGWLVLEWQVVELLMTG